LTVLFSRIGQKRDSNTKVKALMDLRDYFGGNGTDNTDQQQQQGQSPHQGQQQQKQPSKRSQVEALQHLPWLYHHKIHYDAGASVREVAL
jgi:hypothetical protein